MTRTEEVQKDFQMLADDVPANDVIALVLGEIAITLAQIYDLMREKESKDD